MGKHWLRNSGFNLVGLLLPLLLGLFSIPRIMAGIGAERFGLLTLAWAFIGYFSLFDFGIGRALTRLVSVRGAASDLNRPFWAAQLLLLGLSVLLGTLMLLLRHSGPVADLAEPLRGEAERSVIWLATGLPTVLLSAGARALLEGVERFAIVNLLRLFLGLAAFGLPLAVIRYTPALDALIAALVAARYLSLALLWRACRQRIPELTWRPVWSGVDARALLNTGSWLTVSSILGPFISYCDRFVVGSHFGASVVAHYTMPYELVSRLFLLAHAIATALYPAFAASIGPQPERAARLLGSGLGTVAALLVPVIMLLSLFAYEILDLWLGGDFAGQSAPILRLLLAGLLAGAFNHVLVVLLQGGGWSTNVVRVQLLVGLVYVPVLSLLAADAGLHWIAVAWSLRLCAECAGLGLVVLYSLPMTRIALLGAAAAVAGVALTGLAADLPAWQRAVLLAAACCGCIATLWRIRRLRLKPDAAVGAA